MTPDMDEHPLTIEQISMLPLFGVLAYRSAQTLLRTLASAQGSRALVLGGHRGVGDLTVQHLRAAGAEVFIQVDKHHADESLREKEGDHLLVGDAFSLIARQLEESSFDFVLDTIGGKDLWKASRRIIKPNGGQVRQPSLVLPKNKH